MRRYHVEVTEKQRVQLEALREQVDVGVPGGATPEQMQALGEVLENLQRPGSYPTPEHLRVDDSGR